MSDVDAVGASEIKQILKQQGWPKLTMAEAEAKLTAPGSPFEIEIVQINNRPVRWWKNAPNSLREVFAQARAHGDREFLIYESERITYESFARATVAFAKELQSAGVRPGDRVAISMRNLPEWPVAFFATVLIGGVAAALNAWWTPAELLHGLKDSGAIVAVVDPERFAQLQPLMDQTPALRRIYVCRLQQEETFQNNQIRRIEDIIGRPALWSKLPAAETPMDVEIKPDDPASLFYTSGTSGPAKGALGTHRNALCGAMGGAYSVVRGMVRRGEEISMPDPNAPQKCLLVSIPFFHTTGCNALLLPGIMQGGRMVCQRCFEPGAALAAIEKERVTMIGGVPAIVIEVLNHQDRDRYDLSSLDSVTYGGAAGPLNLASRIHSEAMAQPSSGWGMTETSSIHTHFVGEDFLVRPLSCGAPVAVSEIKIVDAAGNALPPGERGELMAYGPNIVQGYWNRPDDTAANFEDGWVRTGDIACIDEEGFLYIVDRKKDIIIRGGENIYCREVEDALFMHSAVREAALVGRPHPVLGETPFAFVTLREGMSATGEELRGFVAERLAAYKIPTEVRVLTYSLPRNAAGKVLKNDLKALLID